MSKSTIFFIIFNSDFIKTSNLEFNWSKNSSLAKISFWLNKKVIDKVYCKLILLFNNQKTGHLDQKTVIPQIQTL